MVFGGSFWSGQVNSLSYLVLTAGAGWLSWEAHPYLVDFAAIAFKLDYKESMVSPFQNSFFSVLSLLFAIFSGNTSAFLYERQKALVQQFYDEINLLEEVVEEAVFALGDESYSILRQANKYIDQEIRAPNNQLPPLEDGLALNIIRTEARRYRRQGADVSGIMDATLKLAQSQNMRQAAALRALPLVHWILLYTIAITFVLTLVLLEPGGTFSTEGRQLLFTVLTMLMTLTLKVIADLSMPERGIYSSTASMEERLEFTQRMFDRHMRLPIIPEPGTGLANVNTNAYFNRSPAGASVSETDKQGASRSKNDRLASLSVVDNQPKRDDGSLQIPKLPKQTMLDDLYGMKPGGGRKNDGNGSVTPPPGDS